MEDITTLWFTNLADADKLVIEWFTTLDPTIRDSVVDFVVSFVDDKVKLVNTFNLCNSEITLLYEFFSLSLLGKWDDIFEGAGIHPNNNLIN